MKKLIPDVILKTHLFPPFQLFTVLVPEDHTWIYPYPTYSTQDFAWWHVPEKRTSHKNLAVTNFNIESCEEWNNWGLIELLVVSFSFWNVLMAKKSGFFANFSFSDIFHTLINFVCFLCRSCFLLLTLTAFLIVAFFIEELTFSISGSSKLYVAMNRSYFSHSRTVTSHGFQFMNEKKISGNQTSPSAGLEFFRIWKIKNLELKFLIIFLEKTFACEVLSHCIPAVSHSRRKNLFKNSWEISPPWFAQKFLSFV